MTSTHCPLRELGARHSLSNLSVYDLVEEFARHRLELEAQLRKASEEEELAKTKKKKREKELDSLLDSDDYCLDSSSDINSKDDLEDKEATTAKDLAREQKERLKALLNNEGQSLCKSRDSNRTLHSRRNKRTIKLLACWGVSCNFTLYQLTNAYILYFKELLSDNSRIFANAIGIGKTRAIVLAVLIEYVHFKN
ncbi:hypothetical protein HBI93_252470 [Parastagonospora nodorum]|nr:hypothetical protein HBI93_252470 [Parastagonospora nodorum]KAH5884790.1 hypothetical protein HBI91_004540 [Parastagonospora nodorum]KAH5919630.1 hypothetical protein HBI87_250830 [Parastagonospora nodorum]KAH5977284.1 hypothetical protein HBI86_031700 [Parastagonospora nodorum]